MEDFSIIGRLNGNGWKLIGEERKAGRGGRNGRDFLGRAWERELEAGLEGILVRVWPHHFSCFRFSSLFCSIFYWFFLAFSCWQRVGVEDYMFVPTIYLVWLGLVWHCMGFSVRCLHFCLIPPSLVYHPSPYPSYIHLEIISARRARIRGSPVVSGNKMRKIISALANLVEMENMVVRCGEEVSELLGHSKEAQRLNHSVK